jgi:hypothetical protein
MTRQLSGTILAVNALTETSSRGSSELREPPEAEKAD